MGEEGKLRETDVNKTSDGIELDRSELDNILFDGFADTSKRRYIYVSNFKTGVTRWSKNAVDDFGLSGEYMLNAAYEWSQHIHPADREKFLQDMQELSAGGRTRHSMDYRACNKNGEYVVCTCVGNVIKGEDGESDLFIGSIENHGIADNVDPITNLYNLYQFWTHLRKIEGEWKSLTILLIGINNFSQINNTYGYSFGNDVLRKFAEMIQSQLRDKGQVYRSDGTRFVCILSGLTKDEIKDLYKEIKWHARHKIYVDKVRCAINLCCGAVPYNEGYDESSLQTCARYAFEQSKDNHGDIVFFDYDLLEHNKKNIEFMSALRNSILNNFEGFYLCYQPIMGANDEQLIGAEALLRWNMEPFGTVPPGVFIPWLENDPSFFELGNWILKQAIMETKALVEGNPKFVINVNITYSQLSHNTFGSIVKDILDEMEFPAQNLCLELTERCRQLEKDYLYEIISYLKSLGIRIAIDDFGTGFSSLNLLGELPIDVLKIDRGFVNDIETNQADQAIVKAVTGCADDLNVHVCLEGLEERSMIDFVKRYSVYSYQGFYFSKPIKIDEFIEKYF